MCKEVFEPMKDGIKYFMVFLCYLTGIVSFFEKNWSQGIAWVCCGYWVYAYFKAIRKNKELMENLKNEL